ncbi:unnamed protein product [Heligmosomoides polygyrus]|uniref:NLPC_P60 domain-containing protein n=1 Tax=Heligmosomoides polygyrus TaxID=6339 RepID=A0A183FJH4_HELPZ|nr:unnamed protein product [Heligmosomoides polygyrus]
MHHASIYIGYPEKARLGDYRSRESKLTTLPVLALRYAMGIADDEILKPGSMLLLELHRNLVGEYTVRL